MSWKPKQKYFLYFSTAWVLYRPVFHRPVFHRGVRGLQIRLRGAARRSVRLLQLHRPLLWQRVSGDDTDQVQLPVDAILLGWRHAAARVQGRVRVQDSAW